MSKKIKQEKGITLIALVITIIVLLILAGVSIAMLIGENGILTKANNASDKTKEANAKEQVELAVLASYGNTGKIDITKLNENLSKIQGLTHRGKTIKENPITELPEYVEIDGYEANIEEEGEIELTPQYVGALPTTVEEAIKTGYTFKKEDNRQIEDEYGNKVTVPEGFKVIEGENVTKGVVIEDNRYQGTKGSQFVWIPVGKVYTDEAKTEEKSKTINLNRYEFADDTNGTATPQNEEVISKYYQELKTSTYGNTIAKESVYDAFTPKENEKNKVEQAGGYYIGRYEARVEGYTEVKTNNSNKESNWTGYTRGKLVEKPNAQVFNYTTQNKASELCRNMYNNTSYTFESDLMNSYAWDTAIVFLQTFDDRSEEIKTKPYSRQNSLNTENIADQGTNNLNDNTKKDKICNIWDMASNCFEWTTETSNRVSDGRNLSCSRRGGIYDANNYYVSYRGSNVVTNAFVDGSFRPILVI